MRRAALLLVLLAAAPALAQKATPSDKPIDWNKPVVGVDGNVFRPPAKDAPLPVEVYTIEDLKAQQTPAVREFIESLSKLAEPCDPAKAGGTVQCTAPKEAPAPAAPPHN